MNAICTGCGITSDATHEYTEMDPVESDGSFAEGRFVCTDCYVKLIDRGQDIGDALTLQRKAAMLFSGRKL